MSNNERPTVTVEDMARVLDETVPLEDGEEWLDREGVDHDVIEMMVAGAFDAFVVGVCDGKTVKQQFAECVANAFVTGWDCGRELGRSSFSLNGSEDNTDETYNE